MSRILRRPMFRGGKVSSYGNGIATGLAKGGSVQPLLVGQHPNKFKASDGREKHSNPLLLAAYGLGNLGMRYGVRPAMKYGKKALDYLVQPKGGYGMNVTGGAGGTSSKYISQTMSPMTAKEMLSSLGTSRLGQYLSQSPTLQLLGYGAKKSPGLLKKATSPEGLAALYFGGPYLKEGYDKMFPGEKAGPREFVGDELMIGDPRDLTTEKALTEDQIKLLELEDTINKLRTADTKETSGIDKIDEDKKIFAKALGKKKARIQDAPNMALGFAARAFEDDATTKSALGKFFADEAKRPSEAAKIDTAAGSAAINKYIKGEISKQELNTLMKKLEMQYSMQNEGKKKTIGQYYIASDAPSFTGKVKEAVIAAYSQEGVTPEFQVTTSVKMDNEFDFNQDAVGVIFIEEDTNEAYTFDSQGNEIPVLNA